MAKTTVRFAPSPTGLLHVGNARTALYNWLLALRDGGTFVLRLDDTDAERSTDAFAEAIVEDLAWLGIEPHRTVRQSQRADRHEAAAARLREAGLLYRCYETPDELERKRRRQLARGKPPLYDRAGLKLTDEERAAFEAEGRTPHWRFLLPNYEGDPSQIRETRIEWDDLMRGPQSVDLGSMSDPVLRRGDGTWLYTLPSVVDDADLGITHVVRGADHVTNTAAQIALFRALDAEVPAFAHHNLLKDAEGEGLSKRKGSFSLRSLREEGFEPGAVVALAALTGTSIPPEPVLDLAELARRFEPGAVAKSDARFDDGELNSLNERLLHQLPYARARARLAALDADRGEAFWNVVRANLTRMADVTQWIQVVDGPITSAADENDADYLREARTLLQDLTWSEDIWSRWTAVLKERTGRKGRMLFMPLRQALTGLDHGPDMADLLPLIGREETIRRLP